MSNSHNDIYSDQNRKELHEVVENIKKERDALPALTIENITAALKEYNKAYKQLNKIGKKHGKTIYNQALNLEERINRAKTATELVQLQAEIDELKKTCSLDNTAEKIKKAEKLSDTASNMMFYGRNEVSHFLEKNKLSLIKRAKLKRAGRKFGKTRELFGLDSRAEEIDTPAKKLVRGTKKLDMLSEKISKKLTELEEEKKTKKVTFSGKADVIILENTPKEEERTVANLVDDMFSAYDAEAEKAKKLLTEKKPKPSGSSVKIIVQRFNAEGVEKTDNIATRSQKPIEKKTETSQVNVQALIRQYDQFFKAGTNQQSKEAQDLKLSSNNFTRSMRKS